MSGLRGRSAVAADHRSALPLVPGIPWWGAAILAFALAALGFTIDASGGGQSLGGVFVASYVLGCVLAVLAVRQSGVFTAVIQPPLILFVVVPFAYFTFHGSTFTGIKDILINCGYPLIERFPLMFWTSAAVLLIGMVRWYLGAASRRGVAEDAEPLAESAAAEAPAAKTSSPRRKRRTAEDRPGRADAAAAVSAIADDKPRPPRRPTRPAAPTSPRPSGAEAGPGSRRSRHSLPPETETFEAPPSRPRRRSTPPPVSASDEPRRRPRSGETREPRERREPRDRRPLPPLDRRTAYDRPDRSDRPQRRDRPEPFERGERPQRRPRVSSEYGPYDDFEAPPPSRPNGSGTHHPVSRVRYRNTDDGESRTEHRTRPRQSRHSAPDSWEYDV